MAIHVSNLATKHEDPTPIRSWVTSNNFSHWLPLKMRTRPLRMRWITWPVSRWWKTIIFLESAKLDDIISPRTEMHWYVHAADVHQPEKWGRRSSGGFWGLWRNGLRWQLKQHNVFRIFYFHASNIGIFSIQAFFLKNILKGSMKPHGSSKYRTKGYQF